MGFTMILAFAYIMMFFMLIISFIRKKKIIGVTVLLIMIIGIVAFNYLISVM